MDPFSATEVIVGGTKYYISIRGEIDNIIRTRSWNLTNSPDRPAKDSAKLIDLGNGQAFRLIVIDGHMRQTIKDYSATDVVFCNTAGVA